MHTLRIRGKITPIFLFKKLFFIHIHIRTGVSKPTFVHPKCTSKLKKCTSKLKINKKLTNQERSGIYE